MTDAPNFAGVERRSGPDVVRVVVAEEAPLLRRQLLLALEEHPRIEVLAEVADAEALVEVVASVRPDAMVLSGHLPPDGPGAATTAARRAHPSIAAVVVEDAGREAGRVPLPGVVAVPIDTAVADVADAVVGLVDARRRSAPGT
jgi:chemotaxis response regulator CheB